MDALTTPSNWQRVRLGDILTLKHGRDYKNFKLGNIPVYGSGGYMLSINNFLHNGESVCIGRKGTIDKPIYLNGKFWVVDTLFYSYSFKKSIPKFIFYAFSIIKWSNYNEATGVPSLTKMTISNIEIPLPPLNEQIAIANILSDLDHYLYSLRALILKKESVKKALSFELLSQRKRLKGFNQAWQRVRLGDICEIKRGVRITKNELDVFGKYPVVSGGVGFLGYTNNFNRYENTITIAQYGTAGYVNFQKNKFWANDVCFCIYPNKDIIKNIFLYYFLKVNQNYLYEISNRNATPYSISKDKILDFEILLPPLDEQIAIANILSALDHEITSLKNKKRQFENIKKALNHDLMSAKIRVLKK
ncbi:restriction endonuclease subunit S [Helicobacter pylori]|uniref:restriction endonuclease subunit S n=1 Tax=Helicobacter pylori TaxID=210 RepID=UPI0019393542|nr:restriction endonuclease subunit S [Helicobacter pylori]MBM2778984.1 restriction endonuclease subunit S [Helicobacter pylori]